jgi:hypothetical protein
MMYLLMIALVVSPSTSAHPAWMVGTWSWRNPGEHGSDCNSDHNITYHRNGRYDFMDETGRWRVAGDRLIETMTDAGGTGDPAMKGKAHVTRFVQVRPGVLRVQGKYPGTMIRCSRD